MDNVRASIKAMVLILDSTLEPEGTTNTLLDFTIADVVDRALIYMNRMQLVVRYEEDLLSYPDLSNDFWDYYDFPIPVELYRVLASVSLLSYKTNTAKAESKREVKSISDNGQSITYGDQMMSYLADGNDSEIFSGATSLMNKFRLAKVVANN